MNIANVTEVSVSQAKSIYPNGLYIEDDFLVFKNFKEVPLPSEPSRMHCLFFAICLKGQAQYTVDAKDMKVTRGDVIIVGEGQVVSNYLLSTDCDGIAVMLSYDFFEGIIGGIHEISSLFLFSRLHPVFKLTERQLASLSEYLYLIQEKISEDEHHFKRELVSTLMKALVYDISDMIYHVQLIQDRKRTRAESIFFKFISCVQEHYKTERRVSWYAAQPCITPKYLSETIKGISKRTPNEWIDYYVILELRVLLKNSDMSIKEIAQYLNFPNQSFLGKYFKEHVGKSPSAYRKE